tara:strand:+ start:6804 stop:7256 length:453 start_codon:yes stop_codon:yes gene_type:complete
MKLRIKPIHMAKSMSNSKRAIDKRNRENKVLFQEAIADEKTSRRDIAKAIGISSFDLTEFFEENPKMYKIYTSRRRELRDIALDNITDIVEDKTHKNHYDASKYIVQNYQTDLDIILDSKDGDDVSSPSVSVDTGGGVLIKFTSDKKTEK